MPLEQPRGLTKLVKMAALAIDEVLDGMADAERAKLPLLLCVAEAERPGRMQGLDEELFLQVEKELGLRFAPQSGVVAHGRRVAVAVALAQVRKLIEQGVAERVVIAATDSLLSWPTLGHYERAERLLTAQNSNGFMPGEGAGALLVARYDGRADGLLCTGFPIGETEKVIWAAITAALVAQQFLQHHRSTTALADFQRIRHQSLDLANLHAVLQLDVDAGRRAKACHACAQMA